MQEIIKHPQFQTTLKAIAKAESRSFTDVEQHAIKCLGELHTHQHPVSNFLSIQAFQYLISRAYADKIDVDEKGIKKLMKLIRKHPVAFIMTHKTYLDTLVLVTTLARYGMPIPFMFAGDNMAFPILKQIGKVSGMIFIRRNFKEDAVYKATLRHFITHLIDSGHHFTWNIEGTRSRTGKLVWPKMGILKYIMDGEKDSNREFKYIPVSIVYDLIPDVKEMTEQAKGKNKNSESIGVAINYIKKLGDQFGRAAIRFGDPVESEGRHQAIIPNQEEDSYLDKNQLPRFAFEVIHRINFITPVTTVSLVCHILLNHFSLPKKNIEFRVVKLMKFIEKRREDVLLDRGKPIGKSITNALNLLQRSGIVQKVKSGIKAQYCLARDEYLPANYYANMASGHLYQRAFIELALVKIGDDHSSNRMVNFWKEIMFLRDTFKFEFFYSNKARFSDEIEEELEQFDPQWRKIIKNPKGKIRELLERQTLFVAESVLLNYLEAYKVVCHTLLEWNTDEPFVDQEFVEACLFKGRDLHWQGHIRRLDSVTRPFVTNGLRLAQNYQLIPEAKNRKTEALEAWQSDLLLMSNRLAQLQKLEAIIDREIDHAIPLDMEVVPGSDLKVVTEEITQSEKGKHIAVFFDLDRTLINDFSAKRFLRSRILSKKLTAREVISHVAVLMIYASGSRDYANFTRLSVQGLKGMKEEEFLNLGEEVYTKYLAAAIYPEARALVASHFAQGHKVVIVSAATPYQVAPVARDLGVDDIFCTTLVVEDGKFTGEVEEMCWNEGKARAAKKFADKHDIDLSKSYFYTDSFEDYPLLEIVGKPQAVNPDKPLAQIAFENNWPIHRFEEPLGMPLINTLRTGLAVGSIYPSILKGIGTGVFHLSQRKGINATYATMGDLGCRMAALDLVIKGKENLERARPAVFCFNHQSNADMFILMKLLRHDFTAIAKKELAVPPFGPILKHLGVVFVDRKDRKKAIEAMKPAVESLKNGVSIAVAPEGTRSRTTKLGPFKKGPFHLAMQAGVPIIPIVIKNAHHALPKGSSLVRPTTIEVVVLDPVDLSNWKRKNLDKHIEKVRNMFLFELDQNE